MARWAGILLVGGLMWSWRSEATWAESEFRVGSELVLTLRTPDAPARLRLLKQRLEEILLQASSPQVQVSLDIPSPNPSTTGSGDPPAQAARILLNQQLLLEVTPADAEAHAAPQPADLARIWADRLQTVFNQESSRQQLFWDWGCPRT
jgi:Zn-dependent protease with chaperone function